MRRKTGVWWNLKCRHGSCAASSLHGSGLFLSNQRFTGAVLKKPFKFYVAFSLALSCPVLTQLADDVHARYIIWLWCFVPQGLRVKILMVEFDDGERYVIIG